METAAVQSVGRPSQRVPSQATSTTAFQTCPSPNSLPTGPSTANGKRTTSVTPMDTNSTGQPTKSTPKPREFRNKYFQRSRDTNKHVKHPNNSNAQTSHAAAASDSPRTDECRVEVSGYPTYARSQDLCKVLSSYGPVQVEQLTRRFAVVSFATPEEALKALEDTMKVNLYGQMLVIKPFTGMDNQFKKQVYKSKYSVVTVEPSKIPLTGSFGAQLAALLAAVRLSQEEVTRLAGLYADLERVMQPTWPGCQAMPFGSITTGLGVKSSDADCFMNIPPVFRHPHVNFVYKAKRILQQYPELFADVLAIPRANTPIVKLFHTPTGTHCDLTFKTPLGALNSKLVAFLLHADPRFLPIAVAVKYWASTHGLSGTGKLTNYALTLLLIFYLQKRGLLPSVAALQAPAPAVLVDGWNTGFDQNYTRLLPTKPDPAPIENILGEFFKFYDTFDLDFLVVCPYLGRSVDKADFYDLGRLPAEFDRYKRNVADELSAPLRVNVPICIQDPFEQCHNVASALNARQAADLRAYIKFAANAYDKEKADGCKGFLSTLLLEKPKLQRPVVHPEYRVAFTPRILDAIIDSDWKAVVRKTVFTIFERMLKLELVPEKKEETPMVKVGKEKERFVTSMTKPLWKRKPYGRQCDVASNVIEKQEQITEQIVKFERAEPPVEFHVVLSMFPNTRRGWVSVRLNDGDVDFFCKFGRYFIANIPGWFVGVLRAAGDAADNASVPAPALDDSVTEPDSDCTDNIPAVDSKVLQDSLVSGKTPDTSKQAELKGTISVDPEGNEDTDAMEIACGSPPKDTTGGQKDMLVEAPVQIHDDVPVEETEKKKPMELPKVSVIEIPDNAEDVLDDVPMDTPKEPSKPVESPED